MHHEPCGLLSDAESGGDFVRANAVLAANEKPHGGKPLFQRDRGILKHGADLERELLLRMVAIAAIDPRLLKIGDFFRVALWTAYLAIGPADSDHELAAILEISEELDGLL
jgi:hypothetical protein